MRVIILFFFIVVSVFAHKLNLFLDFENKNLYIYSYFASASPCKNCKIELLDANNKIVQELRTDEKGECYLKEFSKVKYVKVEALGGHGVKKEISYNDKTQKKQKIDKKENSYIESIFAFLVIIVIFLLLKRIKK